MAYACSNALPNDSTNYDELIQRGYSPIVARKLSELRHDVVVNILETSEAPAKLFRAIGEAPGSFNPKFNGPLRNIAGGTGLCMYGGEHLCLLHLETHLSLDGRLKEGDIVGSLLAYEIPRFMIDPKISALSPEQINLRWLKGDQSPFVSRIVPIKLKSLRGPQFEIGEWVDFNLAQK